MFGSGGVGGEGVSMLGFGVANPMGTWGGGCTCVCGVSEEWVVSLDQGLEGWCYVCVSLDPLCGWQVHVSVYCARRIAAHLRCSHRSIMLHLIDICFLQCICLRQISQIQTCLCVIVGPGYVSTSPDFMKSNASHPVGPHDPLVQKR